MLTPSLSIVNAEPGPSYRKKHDGTQDILRYMPTE
jgi:hypothetical protein